MGAMASARGERHRRSLCEVLPPGREQDQAGAHERREHQHVRPQPGGEAEHAARPSAPGEGPRSAPATEHEQASDQNGQHAQRIRQDQVRVVGEVRRHRDQRPRDEADPPGDRARAEQQDQDRRQRIREVLQQLGERQAAADQGDTARRAGSNSRAAATPGPCPKGRCREGTRARRPGASRLRGCRSAASSAFPVAPQCPSAAPSPRRGATGRRTPLRTNRGRHPSAPASSTAPWRRGP